MVEVFKSTPIRRMTTGGAYVNLTADVVLLSDYEALRAELEQVKRERDEFRDIAARKSNQVAALIKDGGARVDTGCKDRNGRPIYLGDKVRYRLEGPHTKPEYWNPEYEVIFVPPAFTLKHIGGGKDGGSHDFKLRCGGGNGDLEIIERGPYHTALAEPAGEAEPVKHGPGCGSHNDYPCDCQSLTTPPDASAIRGTLPATGPYVDRLIRVFRDRPADDTSAVVLQDYARAALAGAKP